AGDPLRRLMVIESEFGRTLKVMGREGNSLSGVMRQAWDGEDLSTLTKVPMKAKAAHISVIGHTTPADLRQRLSETDAVNGFGNRFVWVRVSRAQRLPGGGGRPELGA